MQPANTNRSNTFPNAMGFGVLVCLFLSVSAKNFENHLTNGIRCAIINKSGEYAPLAQLVEQLTLNQWVLGSSPRWCTFRLVGQVVKTPPSHGGITSSNLVRVIQSVSIAKRFHLFPFRTQKLSSFTSNILGW